MEEKKTDKGFVIKDKRAFDESGDLRKDSATSKEENSFDKTSPLKEELNYSSFEEPYYHDVNFSSFVLSLSTSALYHFGDFPNPASKKSEKNLAAAKQTIDILTMLSKKTVGNLDEKEKDLLDGLLYELRMRYVKETS